MKTLFACLALCACNLVAAETTVIENVTLFDGDSFIENASVAFEGQVLTEVAVGTSITGNRDVVIDGSGLFLIPGLIDAHTHNISIEALELALNWGVTTHLDMMGHPTFAATLRAQQASGPTPTRADLFSSGYSVTVANGHGTQFGMVVPTLDSAEHAQQFVADRVAEGSDYIKLTLEDGSTFDLGSAPTLDSATFSAAVQAAKALDRVAVVHVAAFKYAKMAFEAGAHGLNHIWMDEVPTAGFLASVKEQGGFVIPTLAVTYSTLSGPEALDMIEDPAVAPYLSRMQRNSWTNSFSPNSRAEAFRANILRSMRALVQTGIPILAGSDAPNPGTAWGVSLHTELQLLVDAGLSEEAALKAATSNTADSFDLGKRGRIKQGYKADLVLLNADPRENIRNTTKIQQIWKDGVAYARIRHADLETPAPVFELGTLSQFDSGLQASAGSWMQSTDVIAGGNSKVSMEVVDQALLVRGSIGDAFQFPWAGAALMFDQFDGPGINMSQGSGISFRAKGDPLEVMVLGPGQPFPRRHPIVPSADWDDFFVPFTSFGLDGTGVIYVMFSGRGDEFEFHVDDIALSE